MAGQACAGVFDFYAPLKQRLNKVTERATHNDDRSNAQPLPQGKSMEEVIHQYSKSES